MTIMVNYMIIYMFKGIILLYDVKMHTCGPLMLVMIIEATLLCGLTELFDMRRSL